MIKILLDINVILDVWLQRKPRHLPSASLLSLCAKNKITGYIAANSYSILHYLLSKEMNSQKTIFLLKELRSMTKLIPLDEKIMDDAINSNWKDFEDALQYFSALEYNLSHIITQNKKDFGRSKLVIMTPAEFLASQNFNE